MESARRISGRHQGAKQAGQPVSLTHDCTSTHDITVRAVKIQGPRWTLNQPRRTTDTGAQLRRRGCHRMCARSRGWPISDVPVGDASAGRPGDVRAGQATSLTARPGVWPRHPRQRTRGSRYHCLRSTAPDSAPPPGPPQGRRLIGLEGDADVPTSAGTRGATRAPRRIRRTRSGRISDGGGARRFWTRISAEATTGSC